MPQAFQKRLQEFFPAGDDRLKLVHRPSIFRYLALLILLLLIADYLWINLSFLFNPYFGILCILDGSAFEYLGFYSGDSEAIRDGILLYVVMFFYYLVQPLFLFIFTYGAFDLYTKHCRPVWISQDAIHLGLLRRPFMKKSEISSIDLAPEDPVVPGYYDRKNVIYVACGECRKEDLEQYGVHLLWRQSQFKKRIRPWFAAYLFRYEYYFAPYMRQLSYEESNKILFAGCKAKIPDKMFWLYFDADKYQMLKDWWEK